MSDSEHENATSASVNEATESSAPTTAIVEAGTTDSHAKPNPIASFLLKVWNAIMVVCTTVLSFYVFVLKDDSVVPFVILGVVGLCLPPVVEMFRTMARNKQLAIEYEEQLQKAAMERIQQARDREKKRLEMEKMMALNEIAEQEAIKNTDVAAYKINNQME